MRTAPYVVAAAAVLGGLLWAVKSVAILATGDQPPVIFELAVVLFDVAGVGLARTVPAGGRRDVLLAVALLGLVSAGAALVGGEPAEPFLLPASLATLVVLVGAARTLDRGRTTARLIGFGTVPIITVGGLLEVVDERLLEVPLLVVAGLWMAFGLRLAVGVRAPSR